MVRRVVVQPAPGGTGENGGKGVHELGDEKRARRHGRVFACGHEGSAGYHWSAPSRVSSQDQFLPEAIELIADRETLNFMAIFLFGTDPTIFFISATDSSFKMALPLRDPTVAVPCTNLSAAFSIRVAHLICDEFTQREFPHE